MPRLVVVDIDMDADVDLLIYDGSSPTAYWIPNVNPEAGIHDGSAMFGEPKVIWTSTDLEVPGGRGFCSTTVEGDPKYGLFGIDVVDVNNDEYEDVLIWIYEPYNGTEVYQTILLRNGTFVLVIIGTSALEYK